jgi:cytochrome b6-f complex iron-sulfur subunit
MDEGTQPAATPPEGTQPAATPPEGTQPAATPPSGSVDIPRRRFLRWLLGFSILSTMAMVAAPVVTFLVPPKSSAAGSGGKVLAGTVADIPVGTGKVVAMGSQPTIVVNTAQGVLAYSAICTHLGCIVMYDDLSSTIVCPCHDGRFSPANGAVVSGPPPAALSPVTVSVEGDEIYLVSA